VWWDGARLNQPGWSVQVGLHASGTTSRRWSVIFAFGLLAALAVLTASIPGRAKGAEPVRFQARAGEKAVLSILSAADLSAMEPLIRDFQSTSPDVSIEYTEYITTDLFSTVQAACETRHGIADLVVSSSVDQLVKLVNDGCALRYRSPMTAGLPDWMQWRDEIFGFTFEPAVIVYNRDLVPPEDVQRTRTELIDLLRTKAERYQGKVGSYDIAQSATCSRPSTLAAPRSTDA
jgi:iron(III) transport system substrate-binding protein